MPAEGGEPMTLFTVAVAVGVTWLVYLGIRPLLRDKEWFD